MSKIFLKFIVLSLILLLQGCILKNEPVAYHDIDNGSNQSIDYNKVYNNLLTQYKNWEGVKYKYGGYSKKGIDCSAFVQKTFKERLNFNLPRTTYKQVKIGKEVNLDSLATGDLIFFKTGYKANHVGIYLKDGKFIHVSTKKGVAISRIDNPYFSKHLWKIKRVLY